MKISFALNEGMFNCKMQITDAYGSRAFIIPALSDSEAPPPDVTIDIRGSEFHLSLIPLMPDTTSIMDDPEENDWKDKLANKAANFFISAVGKICFRVGCDYHISGLQDGDKLEIGSQIYAFGKYDRFDFLELFPVAYAFFEVSHSNQYFTLLNAYETNRKDYLKAAKLYAITEAFGCGIFLGIFIYPFQISRVKRLTKNRKIVKVLKKFNALSEADRKCFLEKQDKFTDR